MVLVDEVEDPADVLEEESIIFSTKNSSIACKKPTGKKEEKTPTGKIVGIIRRKWRQYCGILQANLIESTTRHIFIPAERKIPKIRIETRQAHLLQSQRIIVAIDQWPRHSRFIIYYYFSYFFYIIIDILYLDIHKDILYVHLEH